MAKRDDDDIDAEEVAEEADDVAEEAAEEAEEAAEADADDEFEEADADAEDYDEEAAEGEEPYEEEKPRLKPKVTALTMVLCFLNVIAAVGFLFLLMLVYSKRQAYMFAGIQAEAHLAGAGTNEDRQGDTGGVAALPTPKLSHERLTSEARARGASPAKAFTPVEDGFRYRLYEAAPDLLKEEMKDLGEPVATIEEEMNRLQRKWQGDIQDVVKKQAERAQKATDADKRQKIARLLYPLCRNPMQVEKLDAKIKKAQGVALDSMLADAMERRIIADILLPFEMFRSSNTDEQALEKCADSGDVPIDKMRSLLNLRLDAAGRETHVGDVHFGKEWEGQKRWTIEKRQNAAFLLVAVAYARNHLSPLAKEESPFLYPNGLDRAQRISGLYNFTAGAKAFDDALRKWEERVIAAIALDRDGFLHKDLKTKEDKRSESFADKHLALQFRIRQVQSQIREAEARIKDIDQQIDRAKTLVNLRTKDLAEIENRIKQEREISKTKVKELRQLQEQLFENQKILATAAEINARLEARIRALSGVKGPGVKGTGVKGTEP